MLSRRERLQADLDMRERHGEVEDDLDVGVGEQRVDGARAQAEFRGARLGRLGLSVGERDDIRGSGNLAPPSDRRR